MAARSRVALAISSSVSRTAPPQERPDSRRVAIRPVSATRPMRADGVNALREADGLRNRSALSHGLVRHIPLAGRLLPISEPEFRQNSRSDRAAPQRLSTKELWQS